MEIAIHNLQSIRDVSFSLPDTGIISFSGDNSNGKSILEKIISNVVSMDIADLVTRTTLISDEEDSGYIVMIHNNKSLSVLLHKERDKTIMQYMSDVNNPETKVTRSLREGGFEEMLWEFGWRSYGDGSICLQIYPTFGTMPLINTSSTVNTEIVEDVVRDKMAEKFMENYSKVTYPLVQATVRNLKSRKNVLESQIAATKTYDYEAYEALGERAQRCLEFFDHFMELTLEEIELVPDVELVDVPYLKLNEIPLVELAEPNMYLDDIETILVEYTEVLNGKCPTCGRGFVED